MSVEDLTPYSCIDPVGANYASSPFRAEILRFPFSYFCCILAGSFAAARASGLSMACIALRVDRRGDTVS